MRKRIADDVSGQGQQRRLPARTYVALGAMWHWELCGIDWSAADFSGDKLSAVEYAFN